MAERGTFADNARTLIRGGEVRTISLHNTRYETRRSGEELWRIVDGRAEVVGRVIENPERRRWEVWFEGSVVLSFWSQRMAIAGLQVVRRCLAEPVN